MSESFKRGHLLYEGKGKKIFQVLGHEDKVLLFFKDDLTAYQGRKKGSFAKKGKICKNISSLIFRYLKKESILTHFIRDMKPQEMLCFKTKIFPLEIVLRNRLAGSTAERLGFKEGTKINKPLLEFYYKKDELDDPFISEEQIEALNLISDFTWLETVKKQAFSINKKLQFFFSKAGLELIDFKMEFGLFENKVLLADDISPDSCRIWEIQTGERLDKDRFRKGWGKVEESYKKIESLLSQQWG
ncbi:MAG: phosphoribosylaminoimidazolesuccinocarboxamide synthase, partial [Oligoflexia bacterium]|nr:phosphoribosylaminoimidazolesuccinocarboxamide synthase [Oligoflexia bacterium]